MTFEEWDAMTPDYGQPAGFVNGQGSTMTIPSTRESRLRDYQNSLSRPQIDEIVANTLGKNEPPLLTDGFGAVVDTAPDKTTFTLSVAKDGTAESKTNTILSNGDSTEVKQKSTNGSSSIIDTALSALGFSSAEAGDVPLETPVPAGVYESEYFDDVNSFPIDPKQDNLTAELLDGNYNPELYENPKYIIDGSGAFVPNPNYNPDIGQIAKSSAYPDTPEGDLNRIIAKTPYDKVESVMAALKKDKDTLITRESFIAELERQKRLEEIAKTSILDSTEVPIVTSVPKTTGENTEASKDMIEEAVKLIASEQPNELTRINDFAQWADGVSDDAAIREADAVLEQIANQTNVTDRFKKAMAVAFGAMLFGDDFVTAMNTGLGVVADDYTTEAAAQKEAYDAQVKLQLELAKEDRAFQRDLVKSDYNSQRDFAESLRKSEFDYLMKQPEEQRKALALRLKNNMEEGNKVMNSLMASLGDDNRAFLPPDLDGEVSGLLLAIETQSPDGFKLDLFNPEHRTALSGVLNKYATEMKFMNGKAAPAAAYAQEFFIKNELQKFTKGFATIPAELIAPSRAALKDRPFVGDPQKESKRQVYVGNDQELGPLLKNGTEETLILAERIEQLGAQGLGERGTTILLYKDYLDFQKQSFAADDGNFAAMEELAYKRGVGPFTQFVLVHMNDKLTLDNLGKNFDPILANQPEAVDVRALRMYMETGEYDIEQIKSSMK